MSFLHGTPSRKGGVIPRGAVPNPFAVAILAIGIATAGSMFQLLDRTVLRPVPYPAPDEIVVMPLTGVAPIYSRAQLVHLRTLPAFASLEAFSRNFFTLVLPNAVVRVDGGRATGGLFGTLGVVPAVGRLMVPGDSEPGADPVAVLAHAYWREAFGADPGVVGRPLDLVGEDGEVRTVRIVGVMSRNVGHPFAGTSVWLPVTMDATAPDFSARSANLNPVGRLAAGLSVERAQAMVTARVKGWVDEMPPNAFGGSVERRAEYRARFDASVTTLARHVSAESRTIVWALVAFGLFVLLIGGANVATVQISRGLQRAPELGVRYQLGASRARLAAMLVVENAWLAGLGTLGGIALIWASSAFIRQIVPVQVDGDLPALGWATMLVLFVVTVAVTAALGLAGGALAAERRAIGALRAGRVETRRSFVAQRGLVAVSAAMTVVLGMGAGLMFRTVRTLAHQDPGFQVDGLVSIAVAPSLDDPERAHALWGELVGALASRADVGAAGAGYNLPLTGHNSVTDFRFPDHPTIPPDERQLAGFQIASPGYVQALGLRVLEGRSFGPSDDMDHPRVAVVNRAFAREYFEDGSPLGAFLAAGAGERVQIVGVVSDTRHEGLDREPGPRLYYPLAQFAPRELTLVARTEASPAAIAAVVRERLAALDPYAIVTGAERYAEVVRRSMAERTRLLTALWVFAGFGLAISALGLFGTMQGWLSQRRREIGIRSAVGAGPRDVAGWVVRTGTAPLVQGTMVGVVIGALGGRGLAGQLFGVEPWDPGVIAAVVALQLVIGGATLAHPARRAAAAEPAVELRRG